MFIEYSVFKLFISLQGGSVFGPSSLAPMIALSLYGIGYGSVIEPLMKFLMNMSFIRHGVVGLCYAVYDQNQNLHCDHDKHVYCHFKNSQVFLRALGMDGVSFVNQVVALVIFFFVYRLTAYLALRYRVSNDFPNKIFNLLDKVGLRLFK